MSKSKDSIEFKVQPGAMPQVLAEGKSKDEALDQIKDKFIYLASGLTADRVLSDTEVSEIRANYTVLVENDQIEAKNKLSQVLANNEILKQQMKSDFEKAQSILSSIDMKIDDHVRMIKRGTTEIDLDSANTIRLAVDGYYAYYTWVDGKFILAKTEQMPFMRQGELFSSQAKNQEALTELFGIEFGEASLEEVEVTEENHAQYVGRRLACAPTHIWTEDFVDEDTGTLVPIERRNTADVNADKFLTADDLLHILDEGIPTIVLYKQVDGQA